LKNIQICALIASAIALSLLAIGCIAWTTNSQGNVQSIGLPGLPVWTAATPSPRAPMGLAQAGSAELTSDETQGSAWLDELNKWREAAGLDPVAENIELSDGSRAHANYILENAQTSGLTSVAAYGMSAGGGMHSESPGSPGFSEAGARAARGGRYVEGVLQTADLSFDRNEKEDIDGLLIVPFHRLSLLAPWAEVAGYGQAGKFPDRVGALALRGREGRNAASAVMFPPSGSDVPFAAMRDGEWPNPLSACPGYALPVGMPVTLRMLHRAGLGPYSFTDLTDGRELPACAFDAASYQNPNPAEQAAGHQVLASEKAIILIPRDPLVPGHKYKVAIEAGREYQWTFGVIQNAGNPGAQRAAVSGP
jgi:hypothetical protein